MINHADELMFFREGRERHGGRIESKPLSASNGNPQVRGWGGEGRGRGEGGRWEWEGVRISEGRREDWL